MVHLFDLCLKFGYLGTASALVMRGVKGCILKDDWDLGPFSADMQDPLCWCEGWDTCEYCGWAFPVEQGIWMEDGDVDLVDDMGFMGAVPAAREAAATNELTRAMLDISSRDMELPFSGTPKAMARLLDIAILTGNQKAAVNLSKKCQLRPLRRWTFNWNSEGWKAARTALSAGANFQNLTMKGPYDRSVAVTLLDMAIWYGQPNCAEACVVAGIELKGDDTTLAWHKRILRGESLEFNNPMDAVPSEAQTAAAAATRAWLKRLWKSECSQNGVVLYQMMLKMFGKSFPMDLVQEILTLSMPVPKIIKQLDLWAHVGDWVPSIYSGPSAP